MRSRTRESLEEGLDPGPLQTDKIQVRSEPSPDQVLIQTSDPVQSESQRRISMDEKENRTIRRRTKTTGSKKSADLVQSKSSPDLVQSKSSPDLVQSKSSPDLVQSKSSPDLSHKDLLQLLGIMEGEVQARDDVIALLHSCRSGREALEAHYGCSAPFRPLQALQRDAALIHDTRREDVYERPMEELDRLEQKQRETYRRMLEQLLLVEKLHRRTVMELDSEKQKHKEFICKSDDFTNLLEQDRHRLKRLVEQERSSQTRKDLEHRERLDKLKSEVTQLRSFVLLLLDDRQNHVERSDLQTQKIHQLHRDLQQRDQRIQSCLQKNGEDQEAVELLKAQLQKNVEKHLQQQEEATNKVQAGEAEMRQLRLKVVTLANRVEELQQKNQTLQTSENQRRNKSQSGNPNLVSELETLRKKLEEMEGKDEELTKMESQCKEFNLKLQEAQNQSQILKSEFDKVQKRIGQMEKLETVFNKSKAESAQLCASLDREKQNVKELSMELDAVKTKVKELQSSEAKFDQTEKILKDDVAKLKSLAVIMAEERKNLAERLTQEERKCEEMSCKFQEEQAKVSEVTEKLIEESKKWLRLKSEMEQRVVEIQEKLAGEQEKCKQLSVNLSSANARSQDLEKREKELQNKLAISDRNLEEKRKISEDFNSEVNKLRSRLEGDDYEVLQKQFRSEQEKCNALVKTVEELKEEVARSKAIEKGEEETELRRRCRAEEERNEELRAENETLKEKVHEMMHVEDRLSHLQEAHREVTRRLKEEEERSRQRREECEEVTQELENMRRFSRVSRPSVNGRRMVDVPVTSSATQTQWPDDDTAAGFIRKSVQEENTFMTHLRQKRAKPVLDRYPPASADCGLTWAPWVRQRPPERPPERASERASERPRDPKDPSAALQSRPLHIRFTPNTENSRATLEITNPKAEDFFSSTTVIPTLGNPKITIVPKSASAQGRVREGFERAQSPVTITTVSKARHAEKKNTAPSFTSPVSIITVSTTPLNEAKDSSKTVIKVNAENPHMNYSAKGNIITTDDNKIHIHLGASQHSRRAEEAGFVQKSPEKKSSSLMITPTIGRSLRSVCQTGPDSTSRTPVSDSRLLTPASDPRPLTPASNPRPLTPGCKFFLGLSSITRLESRAESLKIQLKKSSNNTSTRPLL